MTLKFPYTRPEMNDEALIAAARMIELPFLTQGRNLAAFEEELCEALGARHVVVCNSGTAALHLAYMAVSVGPGKGLLTTPITFLATANAARMCDAEVEFADVDPRTGNVTAETVERALTNSLHNIAAVTVTHLAGRPCDMPAIRAVTNAHGCILVEDAAHAPLANYRDADGFVFSVGSCAHSDAITLSFHAIKHAPMGEGGAVVTNDPEIAEKARALRNHGMLNQASAWHYPPEADAPWYYEMHQLGWNYRATEFECALGRSQLRELKTSIKNRQRVAERYDELLSGMNNVECPELPKTAGGHAWHLYPVAIDFKSAGRTRGQVMRALFEKGVGTQVHYIPLYSQPYYQSLGHRPLPDSDRYYEKTISLPMFGDLGDADIDFIVECLQSVLNA